MLLTACVPEGLRPIVRCARWTHPLVSRGNRTRAVDSEPREVRRNSEPDLASASEPPHQSHQQRCCDVGTPFRVQPAAARQSGGHRIRTCKTFRSAVFKTAALAILPALRTGVCAPNNSRGGRRRRHDFACASRVELARGRGETDAPRRPPPGGHDCGDRNSRQNLTGMILMVTLLSDNVSHLALWSRKLFLYIHLQLRINRLCPSNP